MTPYNSLFRVVKNQVLPDCRKCVNYIPYKETNINVLSEILDTCSKFVRSDGNLNLKYDSIGKCREDETKCGQLGKLFVPNKK